MMRGMSFPSSFSSSSRGDSPRTSQPTFVSPASNFADRAIQISWWLIVIPFFVFGIQHLVLGRFVTRLAPVLPAWMPAPTALAYVAGAALVAVSIALIANPRRARGLAIGLGVAILLSFVLTHIPRLIATPRSTGIWLQALKCLTLAGGAFALAATARRRNRTTAAVDISPSFPSDRVLLGVACAITGAYLIYCGYLHLRAPVSVSRLVPKWIPGGPGWVVFTGVALVLGGFGCWLPFVRRLAAGLTSLMIFLWVLMLHLPPALTARDAGSTTAVFEALAFSGIALLIAATSTRKSVDKFP
jgi:uncharacterized membrane protein